MLVNLENLNTNYGVVFVEDFNNIFLSIKNHLISLGKDMRYYDICNLEIIDSTFAKQCTFNLVHVYTPTSKSVMFDLITLTIK